MKLLSTGLLMLFSVAMLIICLGGLSGCADKGPDVIRGGSEVVIYRTGDVVTVPAYYNPPHFICLSPEGADDLFRAADRKDRKGKENE